jgi:hypothetical protein
MKTIFPGDEPVVLLPMRDPPLNPILDTPNNLAHGQHLRRQDGGREREHSRRHPRHRHAAPA